MDKKFFRLKKSKVFCMAPWVHIANIPNGDILPCCISLDGSMGNLYQNDIKDIWNNDRYKKFRQDILNDKESKHCQRCYKEESWGNKSTLRNSFNWHFEKHYDSLINQTLDDGTISDMKFLRWDFRFSNLCNLACTTCSPHYSSTWVPITKQMDPWFEMSRFNTSDINKDKFINTIKDQSSIVEEIYFAGGEPLIQSEHYEILEQIESIGRLDQIEFTYSTNLTSLSYKSTNVVNYWRKMKKLRLLVSIDEIDEARLHYIRYPANLDKIISNVKELNKYLTQPEHGWSLTPTWSLMNLHRIKDIVAFFKDNNLLPYNFRENLFWDWDLFNNILIHPEHLSISCASLEWKDFLKNKLNEFQEWYLIEMIPLKRQDLQQGATSVLKNNMQRFFNALNDQVNFDKEKWLHWIKSLDKVRGTNFEKTFPELNWHLQ